MEVLGVRASPRRRANSTALLHQVLAGAESVGAETEIITPGDLNLAPCLACNGCRTDGRCIIQDDFQGVYDQILACDALVLATPVYFGAVSAQAKLLIDRCESFWTMTYELRRPVPPGPAAARRRGVLVATAGQDREIMFAGPRVTFDFLMRSLQGEVFAELLYGGLDQQQAICQDGMVMARAFETGRRLALGLQPEGTVQ